MSITNDFLQLCQQIFGAETAGFGQQTVGVSAIMDLRQDHTGGDFLDGDQFFLSELVHAGQQRIATGDQQGSLCAMIQQCFQDFTHGFGM